MSSKGSPTPSVDSPVKPKINIQRPSSMETDSLGALAKNLNPFRIIPPTPVQSAQKKNTNAFDKNIPSKNASNSWFGINLDPENYVDQNEPRESMDFDRESMEVQRESAKKHLSYGRSGSTTGQVIPKNFKNEDEEEEEEEGKKKKNEEKEEKEGSVTYMVNPNFNLEGTPNSKKQMDPPPKRSVFRRRKNTQPVWYNHLIPHLQGAGNSSYGIYLKIMVYLWEIFEIQKGYIGKIVSMYMSVIIFLTLLGFFVWTDKLLVAYNEWLFYIIYFLQIIASVSFSLDYGIRLLSCITDEKYIQKGEFFGRILFIFSFNSMIDLISLISTISLAIQVTIRLTMQYPYDIVASRE
jgi:hypothetical protein